MIQRRTSIIKAKQARLSEKLISKEAEEVATTSPNGNSSLVAKLFTPEIFNPGFQKNDFLNPTHI